MKDMNHLDVQELEFKFVINLLLLKQHFCITVWFRYRTSLVRSSCSIEHPWLTVQSSGILFPALIFDYSLQLTLIELVRLCLSNAISLREGIFGSLKVDTHDILEFNH